MIPPTEQRNGSRGHRVNPDVLAYLIIVGAALLAYHNSLSGVFVFDDLPSIRDNVTIRRFATLADALGPPHDTTLEGRPVANLSMALNFAVSGTRVWSYHVVNLLIHMLAALTLFALVRRTLSASVFSTTNQWRAADTTCLALGIALLWAVHPIQVEAVTYIVQRVESLMGLFYLLTLYFFVRAATPRHQGAPTASAGWYALSWGACLLGMATKEVMVSAPLIVFFYDRTFISGSFRSAWKQHWRSHLLLASTWGLLAGLILWGGGNRSGSKGFDISVSWWTFWLTQFPAIRTYLSLVIWPHPLIFEYGTFWIDGITDVIGSVLLVASLLGATLWALFARPVFGFLGLFFFAILAPTSLTPGVAQMIVEHRMYLPLAATLCALLPVAYLAVGRRPVLFLGFVAVVATGLVIATVGRNADYQSEVRLWGDTVAKRPGNPIARINFGNALMTAGRKAEAIAQYKAALSIKIKPDYALAHNNLGIALDNTGRTAEAIAQFEQALQIMPAYAEAHYNLGIALNKVGRTPEAIAHFSEATKLKPEYAEAHYNLGTSLGQIGRMPEAIAELKESIRLNPDTADAHNNLAIALYRAGRIPEAIAQFQEVLRIAPDSAPARAALSKLQSLERETPREKRP